MENGASGVAQQQPPIVEVVEAEQDERNCRRREHHADEVDLDAGLPRGRASAGS